MEQIPKLNWKVIKNWQTHQYDMQLCIEGTDEQNREYFYIGHVETVRQWCNSVWGYITYYVAKYSLRSEKWNFNLDAVCDEKHFDDLKPAMKWVKDAFCTKWNDDHKTRKKTA